MADCCRWMLTTLICFCLSTAAQFFVHARRCTFLAYAPYSRPYDLPTTDMLRPVLFDLITGHASMKAILRYVRILLRWSCLYACMLLPATARVVGNGYQMQSCRWSVLFCSRHASSFENTKTSASGGNDCPVQWPTAFGDEETAQFHPQARRQIFLSHVCLLELEYFLGGRAVVQDKLSARPPAAHLLPLCAPRSKDSLNVCLFVCSHPQQQASRCRQTDLCRQTSEAD